MRGIQSADANIAEDYIVAGTMIAWAMLVMAAAVWWRVRRPRR